MAIADFPDSQVSLNHNIVKVIIFQSSWLRDRESIILIFSRRWKWEVRLNAFPHIGEIRLDGMSIRITVMVVRDSPTVINQDMVEVETHLFRSRWYSTWAFTSEIPPNWPLPECFITNIGFTANTNEVHVLAADSHEPRILGTTEPSIYLLLLWHRIVLMSASRWNMILVRGCFSDVYSLLCLFNHVISFQKTTSPLEVLILLSQGRIWFRQDTRPWSSESILLYQYYTISIQ